MLIYSLVFQVNYDELKHLVISIDQCIQNCEQELKDIVKKISVTITITIYAIISVSTTFTDTANTQQTTSMTWDPQESLSQVKKNQCWVTDLCLYCEEVSHIVTLCINKKDLIFVVTELKNLRKEQTQTE